MYQQIFMQIGKCFLLVMLLGILFSPAKCNADQDEIINTFEINEYRIKGNTILKDSEMKGIIIPFMGEKMRTDDIEKVRDMLEKAYHSKGYPSVLVNIPEQTVDGGVVKLEVVESTIRRVRVTGNNYHTMEYIKDSLPALATGNQLFVPQLQKELNRLNRNRNLKVAPVLLPGKEPGTIDVELKVKDRLPLHGSLEINNRASHDTSNLRFNGSISYENLWQKKHSISLQYQTSPNKMRETQVVAGSYILPSPWRQDDLTVLYAVFSDSENSFGSGFQVLGKGNIYGIRQIFQLPPYLNYSHNLTVGVDYKDFDETLGVSSQSEDTYTPVTYVPLSFSYTASLPDSSGLTQFSGGLNMVFRSMITDMREFEVKRYKAKGNYLYATLGVERQQKLPANLGLYVKLDGQLANQPLIANEQYSAGGMTSVRAYKESEETGDNALHAMFEISAPEAAGLLRLPSKVESLVPFLFYDFAYLTVMEALPDTEDSYTLNGIGAGLRSRLAGNLTLEANWGLALSSTGKTDSGDHRSQFIIKYEF